jgi:hypothetical protein
MKIRVSFLLIVCLILSIPISAQTFKASVAVRKITPDPLMPVSGGVGTNLT